MRKNFQIHLYLETELMEKLKNEALEKKKTVSDICRQKIKEDTQLDRIEAVIGKIYKLQGIEDPIRQ